MTWRSQCRGQREKTVKERFFEKIAKHDGGCWIWIGCKDKDGYGFFRQGGKNLKAHRYILELITGRVPQGYVCHHCDVPSCVNPDHLWIGSDAENKQDSAKKGRQRNQKLMVEDVLRIREAMRFGASVPDISDIYNVGRNHVYGIIKGRKWAHIDI